MEQLIFILRVNEFFNSNEIKEILEFDEPNFVAFVSMLIEEYAITHDKDTITIMTDMLDVAKKVNSELGKYTKEQSIYGA